MNEYEIHVEGPITERFGAIFPHFVVAATVDKTVLHGPVTDGAQLVAIIDLLVTMNAIPVLIERMG